MYYQAQSLLGEAGYEQYEISNFSRAECRCRHNVGYWTGAEYLGLGLGASSCVKGQRFSNETDREKYQKLDFSLDGLELLHGHIHLQSRKERMEEFMFLGLRMMQGVSGNEFLGRFGRNMWKVYDLAFQKLPGQGLIEVDMPWVRLTARGIDVSNRVFSEFLLE